MVTTTRLRGRRTNCYLTTEGKFGIWPVTTFGDGGRRKGDDAVGTAMAKRRKGDDAVRIANGGKEQG
jgi:hypothetical protein